LSPKNKTEEPEPIFLSASIQPSVLPALCGLLLGGKGPRLAGDFSLPERGPLFSAQAGRIDGQVCTNLATVQTH
jgi:hypothetical protein